ncbi:MAG: hypothetical protein HOC79_00885 [Euryarchaeota archaeon]|nr:hypothetical protein [Euryarchaeota archaeon]
MSTKKDTPKAKEIVIDGPNLGMAHSGNSWPASAKGPLLDSLCATNWSLCDHK